ncbi:MAG TPA: NAD-dependent dehydratase, partial [Actinomycetota bacterium]|nr:NAD-dependent dehydratase [Actinomycetota bacterium]
GREISIADLVELLFEVTGRRKDLVSDEARIRPKDSEVHRLLCDATRAREWAGWTPQVSLEEGLRRTAGWVRDHLDDLTATRYHV